MATKICTSDYATDTYRSAKFRYDPMRGFCSLHMRSCLPSVHSVTFLGSYNSLPQGRLRRYWRSVRQRTRFQATRCLFRLPENWNFTFWSYFLRKI